MQKRCQCGSAIPYFGFEAKKPLFCNKCRPEGTFNVRGRMCECGRAQPSFGLPGGTLKWCANCPMLPADATYLYRNKCLCGKALATFGYTTRKPEFCKDCKPDGDTAVRDVVSKTCACGKLAQYKNPEDGALFCNDCAPVGVKSRKIPCLGKACPGQAQNRVYEGYCARCFSHLFPDKPAARNYKTKERLVLERLKPVLAAEFPHLETSFDRAVSGGCSRRRPDVFVDALTHSVIGEIDEEGHDKDEYCACENKRMMQLFQDLGNRPVVFVRINPDAYTDPQGRRHGSCFGRDSAGKLVVVDEAEWRARVDLFIERVRESLRTVPEREVTVEHLYYDGFC